MDNKIKVSIVDDNIELTQSLTSIFKKNEPGIKLVATYPDAEMVIAKIEKEPVDILIVDINLPGVSGIELIEQLMLRELNTQFLVYTIHDGNEYLF